MQKLRFIAYRKGRRWLANEPRAQSLGVYLLGFSKAARLLLSELYLQVVCIKCQAGVADIPVGITATIPQGKLFVSWTGDSDDIFTSGSRTAASSTITMPLRHVDLVTFVILSGVGALLARRRIAGK